MASLSFLVSISIFWLYGQCQTYTMSNEVSYAWNSQTIVCPDINCIVNCYGSRACFGATIHGPKDAILTVNCNTDDDMDNPDAQQGLSCQGITIRAENSSRLHIDVFNENGEFTEANVYTPTNLVLPNTFITCGVVGPYNTFERPIDSNPNWVQSVCGRDNTIYSKHGFESVKWTYSGSNNWALDQHSSLPNKMECGTPYTFSGCSPFIITNGRYFNCPLTNPCHFAGSYIDPPSNSVNPSPKPTPEPSPQPSPQPSPVPSMGPIPTPQPTPQPAPNPTMAPIPTVDPTPPTQSPIRPPSIVPTPSPSIAPKPTPIPTSNTLVPTPNPIPNPTSVPVTDEPTTKGPTSFGETPRPTPSPAPKPTPIPTSNTLVPTPNPIPSPTSVPVTDEPTTKGPTSFGETLSPTPAPAKGPTVPGETLSPSPGPAKGPTVPGETLSPTPGPIKSPTSFGETLSPTPAPAKGPTVPGETLSPTPGPIKAPTSIGETPRPTSLPTPGPTKSPIEPGETLLPTPGPTSIGQTRAAIPTPIPSLPSEAPSLVPIEDTGDGDEQGCDADESLIDNDCDEASDEPDNECSVMITVAFDVCYIEPYEKKKDKLWINIKDCCCVLVFGTSVYSVDGKDKNCFIDDYMSQRLVTIYEEYGITVYDDTSIDECILQHKFMVSSTLYHDDCDYVQSLSVWLLDQGNDILDPIKECLLSRSKQQSIRYRHGFGRIVNINISVVFRDEAGDSREIKGTNSAGFYSFMTVFVTVFAVFISYFV